MKLPLATPKMDNEQKIYVETSYKRFYTISN